MNEDNSRFYEPEDDIREVREPSAFDEAWSDIRAEAINHAREVLG